MLSILIAFINNILPGLKGHLLQGELEPSPLRVLQRLENLHIFQELDVVLPLRADHDGVEGFPVQGVENAGFCGCDGGGPGRVVEKGELTEDFSLFVSSEQLAVFDTFELA